MTASMKWIVALVLAALVLSGTGVAVAANWTTIWESIGPECSVGITGTDTVIQVRGLSSHSICQDLLSLPLTYSSQGSNSESQVCVYELQDSRVSVYDTGVLHMVGRSVCTSFAAAVATRDGLRTLGHALDDLGQAIPVTPAR